MRRWATISMPRPIPPRQTTGTIPARRESDPALPGGAEPLAAHVTGPAALRRRLAQIGVVARGDGPRLRAALKPGQRLVSREGDLWRWDGLTGAAEAPSPAARRLAEKNRLGDLEQAAQAAQEVAARARRALDEAIGEARAAAQAEAATLEAARLARRALDQARETLAAAERKASEVAARRSALSEAIDRLGRGIAEMAAEAARQQEAVAALPATAALEASLLEARVLLGERRIAASDARARVQTLRREAELRAQRRQAIAADMQAWRERAARSGQTAEETRRRIETVSTERAALLEAPDTFLTERRRLLAEIESAEAQRAAPRPTPWRSAKPRWRRPTGRRERRWRDCRRRARRGRRPKRGARRRGSASPMSRARSRRGWRRASTGSAASPG